MDNNFIDSFDKIFKAIELAQGRLKIIADLAVKGVIFHLAISAFSITFAFQKTVVPNLVIFISNIIINLLALLATIFIMKDVQNICTNLYCFHNKLDLKIDKNEFNGTINVARLYAILCVVLIIFWIGIHFIKIETNTLN